MTTALRLAPFVLIAAGCDAFGPTLDGSWTGEMDCGEEAYDLDMEVERVGDSQRGSGAMELRCDTGEEIIDCTLEFDFEVDAADGLRGEQVVEFEVEDCFLAALGERYEVDCPAPLELDWDGKHHIEGEADDCDVVLDRS